MPLYNNMCKHVPVHAILFCCLFEVRLPKTKGRHTKNYGWWTGTCIWYVNVKDGGVCVGRDVVSDGPGDVFNMISSKHQKPSKPTTVTFEALKSKPVTFVSAPFFSYTWFSRHLQVLGWSSKYPPPSNSSHQDDITFLVGNPELNLHLWLESWVGG